MAVVHQSVNDKARLPLRRSLPTPSPTKAHRQRFRVRRQMPFSTQALNRPASASFASPTSSIIFRRCAALFSLPRPTSRRHPTFSHHQQSRCLSQGLLLALQLLLEGLELLLVLFSEPFALLLPGHRQRRLAVCIKCLRHAGQGQVGVACRQRLTCSGNSPPRTAVSTELWRSRHHLSVQPPRLPPFVEGDHVDAQLLLNPDQALSVERAHPPFHVSLDCLAVSAH